MKYKQRIVLLVTGCVILIVGWYFIYYLPMNNKINKIKSEINEINEEINLVAGNIGGLENLRKNVNQLETELEQYEEKIITKNKLVYVSNQLKEKGIECNLRIEKITPKVDVIFGEEKEEGEIVKLPISMNIVGHFFDFRNFLESFDDFPFLIKAGQVSVETDDAIYPDLLITLTVYVFAYQE